MSKEQLVRQPKNIAALEAEILALEQGGSIQEPVVEETPVVEEKKEDLVKEVLTKEEETWKQRYADLRRHADKQKQELEQKLKQKETPSVAQPKTPEEVKAWMEEYPDVAGIVIRIAQEQSGVQDVSERLRALEKKEEELKRAEAQSKLRDLHPDFDEITASNSELHTWAAEQPSWMQDILYDGDDVQAVGRIISLYKVEAGVKTPQARTKETASAVSTKSKSTPSNGSQRGRIYKESEIDAMSMAEYEKLEADILAAQREGRLVKDVRGAAY